VNTELQTARVSGSALNQTDSPFILKEDLVLLNEGRNWRVYRMLGARLAQQQNVWGTHFAVWAPNARRVTVMGDFNHWSKPEHP